MINKYFLVRIVAVVSMISQSPTFANGTNPPRPYEAGSVDYDCEGRKSGLEVNIKRPILTSDGVHQTTIEIRLGNSSVIDVKLSSIFWRQISNPGNIEPDGFLKLDRISLISPKYIGSASIKPTKNRKNIRLLGISSTGAKIDLPIANCKNLNQGPPIPMGTPNELK